MAIWAPSIEQRPGTRASALVEAMAEDIAAGRLQPGDRLPPQRDLAYALGLSSNTVMRAYAEAAKRGYVVGEVGRGTYVRRPVDLSAGLPGAGLARPCDEGPIDFSLNLPFIGGASGALSQTLAAIAGAGGLASYLDHQDGQSRSRHQVAGATWVSRLGVKANDENVILTNGAQQGIFASLLAMLRPGDTLLTEELTYPPVKAMVRRLGARMRPVAIDAEGLVPEALDAACRASGARTVYCTPTLHTPTTATMSEARRRQIAAVAETHGLTLVEDDVFGLLPPERPQALAALAPDRTILVTSVSKSVAPGLRIGYVLAPEALVPGIRAAVSLSSWMPPPLMAEIASRWIGDGTALELNNRQRLHAARRQAMAQELLAGCEFSADPHGLHLWLRLPDRWSQDAFAAAAERVGVLLQPSSVFAATSRGPAAVRLCLSHEASDERVARGLAVVMDLLEKAERDDELVV
ncbi:PLP-dependent aminotransferase family protein [Chelatococcus sp. SYSU_G07232]|uniref:PLP-dependent aminotransferase family protein n=2 Tax=Chelatococcus albus TaxID=3047466 RepID=A0ABT7AKM8_9HYPH|nr:PLP-dependent aminotransferase family protein [Chelatococcus sp. SYSU_G07232]MDJ1159931.1 PLP-dependent aminotransferase family protein [Chelatococcus sp. SYSU_G07232]